MKKLISVCLSAALVLSMSACGAQTQSQSQTQTQSESQVQTSAQTQAKAQTVQAETEKVSSTLPVVTSGAAETGSTAAKKDDAAKIAELKKNFLAKADEVVVDKNSVTFTDASGRGKITIKKKPQKVAGLYGSFNALWYEAGGKLAGCVGGNSAVDVYKAQIGHDITKDEGMSVIATSNAASKWSVEEIINFKPDLVFCALSMKGYATIGKAADAANIPVIAVDYNDFSDYLKWFKVFCNLNDRADLWNTVALKNLNQVISVILQVPNTAPKIATMFDVNEANLSGTLMGQMIDQLGGVNIADALNKSSEMTRMEINLESIYAANPEAIIVQCHQSPALTEAKFKKTFDGNPVWQSLSAVKNNRVYYMDNMLFHIKPNGRFGEAYLKMAQVMYPNHKFVLDDKK